MEKPCVDVRFHLKIDAPKIDGQVFLNLEGGLPFQMQHQEINYVNFYVIQINFAEVVFPLRINYFYTVGSAPLMNENKRTALITRMPLNSDLPICINDVAGSENQDKYIKIRFFLHYGTNDNILPVMEIATQALDRSKLNFEECVSQMIHLERYQNGIWSCLYDFNIFMSCPLFYKYHILDLNTNTIMRSEEGRFHSLYLDSPATGSFTHIYDNWSDFDPVFPIFTTPITTSQSKIGLTSFHLFFQPKETNRSIEFAVESSPEKKPCIYEKSWMYSDDIPYNQLNFQFSLVCDNQVLKDQLFRVVYENSRTLRYPQISECRYCFSKPSQRFFGVYVQLISIRTDRSKYVGDFGSIINFADWCKKCQISQIYLHIDKINNNCCMIDPSQVDVEIGDIRSLTIDQVRDAKLAVLHQQFSTFNKQDEEFCLFKELNKDWLPSNDLFWIYVQYICHSQLEKAFFHVNQKGILIITDVPYSNPYQELLKNLIVVSHFSHAIVVHNLINEITQVTKYHINQIFHSQANQFIENFCEINGLVVRPKEEYMTIDSFKSFFIEFEKGKIEQYLKYWNDDKRKSQINDTISHLGGLSSRVPSTIILEKASTQCIGFANVKAMKLTGASDYDEQESDFISLPDLVSAEMMSEFTPEMSQKSVYEILKRRTVGNATSCIVYLADLLFSLGVIGRDPPQPIELLEHHCRFQFPFTISDLMKDYGANSMITQFIEESNRIP